jgi:hypothetical protein
MRSLLLIFTVLAVAVSGSSIELPETSALVTDDRSQLLLNRNFIFAQTKGAVPVPVGAAINMLKQADFLTRVQEEYANTLPPGKLPEFTVQQSSSNTWYFINARQERTDITEVAQCESGTGRFDLAYYTEGRRFFGFYQALIHVRLSGSGSSTDYTVAVYAYPENGLSRFFARHLNLVDKYFRSKTDEISGLAVQISTRLCNPESTDSLARLGF